MSANEDQVREALNASGYIFEQQIAERLEKLGFHVETNWIYTDPNEGKARELDVRAYKYFRKEGDKNDIGVAVELLIECKSGSNPYVFFSRRKGTYDKRVSPSHHLFPHAVYQMRYYVAGRERLQSFKPYAHLSLYNVDPMTAQSVAITQFCRVTRKRSKFEANHADVHSGLVLPLAGAATYRASDRLKTVSANSGWMGTSVYLIYPIALVGGHVYRNHVENQECTLQRTSYATLQHKPSADDLGRIYISFVSAEKLEEFIENEIAPFVQKLVEMLHEHPEKFTQEVIDKD